MIAQDAPAWLRPGTGLSMPHAGASHDDWSRYAVSRGIPADQAAALSRDQIRVEFCPPGTGPAGEPVVDLLERDPEALAARRDARRKPVVTPAQPGSLTASRITTWPGGIVAEIVIDEQAGAFGRWFQGGSWSAWWPIADGVRDASLPAADGSERSPRPW